MNISSLPYHFDDFETLIESCPVKPRITEISAYHLRTNKEPLLHINLKDYTYEFTPTDSNKRGILIYFNKSLKYKIKTELQMYKLKEIGSTFIEIIEPNPKK